MSRRLTMTLFATLALLLAAAAFDIQKAQASTAGSTGTQALARSATLTTAQTGVAANASTAVVKLPAAGTGIGPTAGGAWAGTAGATFLVLVGVVTVVGLIATCRRKAC